MEAYQAYADYNDMMDLTEAIISEAAMNCNGTTDLMLHDKPLSLKPPFIRASMTDLFIQHAGSTS